MVMIRDKPRKAPASGKSGRKESAESMFTPVLENLGYSLEHVFPIGIDPETGFAHYVVVSRRNDGKDFPTWIGIDRGDGRPALVSGHYGMNELEAFQDATSRAIHEKADFDWVSFNRRSMR